MFPITQGLFQFYPIIGVKMEYELCASNSAEQEVVVVFSGNNSGKMSLLKTSNFWFLISLILKYLKSLLILFHFTPLDYISRPTLFYEEHIKTWLSSTIVN